MGYCPKKKKLKKKKSLLLFYTEKLLNPRICPRMLEAVFFTKNDNIMTTFWSKKLSTMGIFCLNRGGGGRGLIIAQRFAYAEGITG